MIAYRDAKPEDMEQVAKLHKEAFPEYFLSQLCGKGLLASYYRTYLSEGAPFVLAVRESNEIVGFCMGYCIPSQARRRFLRRNVFQIALRLIWLDICMNKMAIERTRAFIKHLFRGGINKKVPSGPVCGADADLLSICVKQDCMGMGIADSLINSFEDRLKERGIKSYTLMVFADNTRARRFYEKHGLACCSIKENECKYSKRFCEISL